MRFSPDLAKAMRAFTVLLGFVPLVIALASTNSSHATNALRAGDDGKPMDAFALAREASEGDFDMDLQEEDVASEFLKAWNATTVVDAPTNSTDRVDVLEFLTNHQSANLSDTTLWDFITLDTLKKPTWANSTPEMHINDEDYFYFTEKNLNDSKVKLWYPVWTVIRQADPDWNELGEWKLFYHDFEHTKNFECSIETSTCKGALSLQDLQKLYPGDENRPLVRRIYFVSLMHDTLHDYATAVSRSLDRTKTNLVAMIPDLVDSFTDKSDPNKRKNCAIIQSIGNAILSTAIQVASALAIALGNPEIVPAMMTLDAAAAGSVSLDAEILVQSERAAMDGVRIAAKIEEPVLGSLELPNLQLDGVLPNIEQNIEKEFSEGARIFAEQTSKEAEEEYKETKEWREFRTQLLESSKFPPRVTIALTKEELDRFAKHCTNRQLIQKIRALDKPKVTISLKPEEQKTMIHLAGSLPMLKAMQAQRQYAKELLENLEKRALARAYARKQEMTKPVVLFERKGKKFKFEWWEQIKQVPQMNWPIIKNMIPAAQEDYSSLDVNGGYGDGGYLKLCSQFEGDFQDQTAPNIQKIQSWIPGQFEFIRKKLNGAYGSFYKGQIDTKGNPSAMGLLMMVSDWTRKDGFLGDLEDAEGWQFKLERNMVKDIISTLLSKGYNYIRCTHDPRAMSMCEAAQKFSSAQKISQSRFCPRPDTEPTLICQAEHWYMAKIDAHAKLMSGLDSFEVFQRDRFKFTLPEFFQEAYNEWTRCGNKCNEITWKLGPFERDMNWAGTFHLPICKSDQTHIADFTHDYEWWVRDGNPKHWPGWYRGEFTKFSFPSSCGDWKSNDTMEFLEAMNAGEWKNDSSPFYHPIAEMLWRDRIPRELQPFPPYQHFVAMCAAQTHFPGAIIADHWIANGNIDHHKNPEEGRHYRCDDVLEETKNMDEEQANRWFCIDSNIGRDIQKDTRDGYHLGIETGSRAAFAGLANNRILEGYRPKCNKWKKDRHIKKDGSVDIKAARKEEEKKRKEEEKRRKEADRREKDEQRIAGHLTDGLAISVSRLYLIPNCGREYAIQKYDTCTSIWNNPDNNLSMFDFMRLNDRINKQRDCNEAMKPGRILCLEVSNTTSDAKPFEGEPPKTGQLFSKPERECKNIYKVGKDENCKSIEDKLMLSKEAFVRLVEENEGLMKVDCNPSRGHILCLDGV